MSGFVQLHCHTTWSLLDGAIPAETLPHLAAALGYEAVAMTDHDALTGAVRFTRACAEAGVKPIYGAELTVAPSIPPHPHGLAQPIPLGPPAHVTVIARDNAGYANLCRLISEAHLGNERGQPLTTFEAIARRAEGLFVLSGCERGEVARLAAAGRVNQAVTLARRWRAALGEGYRIEVFDHRSYGDRALRDRLLKVAHDAGVAAVATNDVHYAGPGDARTHEVLHAIKDIVPLSRAHALRANSEYYLKPPAAMRHLFGDVPEVAEETLRIAEACEVDLDLGRYHFPHLRTGAIPTAVELRQRCYAAADRRFGRITREVADRLEHELDMIIGAETVRPSPSGLSLSSHRAETVRPSPLRSHGLAKPIPSGLSSVSEHQGFAAYFLLVADIVDHTKRVLGIRCACRGSAAGSLVCYVLGISDVDPVRYDLLFERFMNERRAELPDIDIDVESHRRDEVLQHILETYGADQTAMCCMVDTFRARMAIRDVGKAMGLPPEEVDAIAKAFPRIRASDIPKAMATLPELRGLNLGQERLAELFEMCAEVDGFPRHLALHPSGVILSSPDLADRVPMQASYGGFTMLQADKHDVEDLGLVKLDVLGVRMLSAMAHACDEIARTKGASPDLAGVAHDDESTYRLMRSSQTLGCFQIESPGQRDLLARLQPERFEDLIVEISLFRPGPVKSDMVTPYLKRRHGYESIVYLHPSLEPVLAETYGVIIYHEQLIRAIASVTGCSLADADHVRRHLDSDRAALGVDADEEDRAGRGAGELGRPGEPLPDRYMDRRLPGDSAIARWFQEQAIANGSSPAEAARLWVEVFAFASFGFCKSHAAAFALPTYLSAWLKAHHPAALYAGLLTHDPGMYPRRLIAADARHFGVAILPIDVNRSDKVYRVEALPGDARSQPNGTGSDRAGSAWRDRENEAGSARRDRENEAGSAGRSQPHGVRLAFSEVRDISEAEIDSLLAARREGGPFTSLEDLWRRAELSRPVLENLVHIGALDPIRGEVTRRALLWRATDLARRAEAKPQVTGQLGFELDEPVTASLPGLRPYSEMEETEAELAIGSIDARRHVMELYRPLLAELGCTPATGLPGRRNGAEVWVAGVKVASQTPAIRSGQRIIFVTLDDLTGPIDITVFERAQERCAAVVFHSWLQLVRGTLRKRGAGSNGSDRAGSAGRSQPDKGARLGGPPDSRAAAGITIVAEEVFDLAELATARAAGAGLAEALATQRAVQAAGGLVRQSPARAPARVWHSSGGSAGR